MNTELTQREERMPETVGSERWLKPACDVFENENEWLITADLPGVINDALSLHLDKDELTIEGKRLAENWNDGVVGYRRTFALPSGVDGDKVAAKMKFGVVKIHLPKSAAIKPRRISVKAG